MSLFVYILKLNSSEYLQNTVRINNKYKKIFNNRISTSNSIENHSHYHHYSWPNNELPSTNHSFLCPNGKCVGFKCINCHGTLVLIGCSGGVMPCSTNKIMRIPFSASFWWDFFYGHLQSLPFHKFILVLVQNTFK